MDRRDVLKLGAAATVAASLDVRDLVAGAEAAARFFTPAEFALVDELAELIIPTDDHSPGARAAGATTFIDGQLAEAWTPEQRGVWRDGLQAIDDASRGRTGRAFMESTPAERLAVLTALAANEADPQSAAEKFFVTLKSRVAHAYYTSEIGIKQEMGYLGNTYLNEFVGYDVRTEQK